MKEQEKNEEVNKKMRKQFTNSLLNSKIDKKIITEIIGDEKNFLLFFNIYLLGLKDMFKNITDLSEQKNKKDDE